ncbi:N-acetylmuramidase domain-containing protein [Acidovorax sp. BLS4]|uniref:N-acetylmuramidase domain-containing protein n=1 Tax=Acidovorax sp. BLS4 TaxID=3273430 RepID=UPI002943A396|nr:N-acetylmuramidase domain-containing protein [Paracidovorax avenae]WOI45597.1 N-acetylmuramidase domain-containing protein [Paracidovorax avenae]
MAKEFGCDVAAIKAVMKTESGDGGYLDNGLPKMLFERHRFYALTDPNGTGTKKENRRPHPYAAFPDIFISKFIN